jgi:hypothetical protein
MEDKSELIKTFLMSVEFSGRDDIEIIISKTRDDFYRITIYISLGPNDGIYSRINKRLELGDIKNLIHKYGICNRFYLHIEQGWKDYYKPLDFESLLF